MTSWRTTFIERLGPGGFSGATFGDWLRVLVENRFAVDVKYWPRAALITSNSLLNSFVRLAENRRHGAAIANTEVPPPLFVLGIWRSGTTHLHNLLTKDDRFAFPNTYQVLYPHTFLTTEPSGSRVMQSMMPATRPMDNVKEKGCNALPRSLCPESGGRKRVTPDPRTRPQEARPLSLKLHASQSAWERRRGY